MIGYRPKYLRISPCSERRLRSLAKKIGIKVIVVLNTVTGGDYRSAITTASKQVGSCVLVIDGGTVLDHCRLVAQLWGITSRDPHTYAVVLPDGSGDIDHLWEVVAQNNMGAKVED